MRLSGQPRAWMPGSGIWTDAWVEGLSRQEGSTGAAVGWMVPVGLDNCRKSWACPATGSGPSINNSTRNSEHSSLPSLVFATSACSLSTLGS